MGTRADFYVGRGKDAEWLGSIGLDGYPEGIPENTGLVVAENEKEFRAAVGKMHTLHFFTSPEMGWPWPWDSSHLTDYAYAWDDNKVWISRFGCAWADGIQTLETAAPAKVADVPDMSGRKRVTYGPRSGLLAVVAAEPAKEA